MTETSVNWSLSPNDVPRWDYQWGLVFIGLLNYARTIFFERRNYSFQRVIDSFGIN